MGFIQKTSGEKEEMSSLETKDKKVNVVPGQSSVLKYLLLIPYAKMKQCLGVLRKLEMGFSQVLPQVSAPRLHVNNTLVSKIQTTDLNTYALFTINLWFKGLFNFLIKKILNGFHGH